jgi:cytochrome P450
MVEAFSASCDLDFLHCGTNIGAMTLSTPPRVPGHFILGNLPAYRKDPLGFGRTIAAQYGDVVDLRIFNRRLFFLAHPEHIHQVLVQDAEKFHKSPVYRIFLGRALGEGLLTSEGELWRRQRRLAQPVFHHGQIQSYAQTMVEYADAVASRWRDSEMLSVNKEMARVTLEVVCRTFFSTDIRAEADRIGFALTELLEAITEATDAAVFLPAWLPTRNNRRIRRAVAELDSVIMPLIAARRRSGEDTGDLLSMLLLARDDEGQGMSDRQLRDEAVTIVLAGPPTRSPGRGFCSPSTQRPRRSCTQSWMRC